MPANVENSAVATGLEKVSFHSNPKERHCQRMLKLLHNCTHLSSVQSLSRVQLYKKDLHDPENYDGGITHLEPDILECKVEWAFRGISTNKSSGGDGIPIELFQ